MSDRLTAKQKAVELLEKYNSTLIVKSSDHFNYGYVAKQCALLAVSEMIKQLETVYYHDRDILIPLLRLRMFHNS